MKKFRILLLSLVAVSTALAADAPEPIWRDEFDGPVLDATKWGYRGLGPRKGGVNVKEAITLDGKGHLVITTIQVGDKYHTGIIGTQGKFERAYGYYECRVKLQKSIGHWSAFWLQSPKLGKVLNDTKASGTEIDIFEYLRRYTNRMHHNLHWDGYGKAHKSTGKRTDIPGLGESWHTVGLEWTQDEYIFTVDGKETWRTKEAVSGIPQYIILSLEVGPWAGDIGKAKLPDSVAFDYVRVYAKRPGTQSK